MSAMPYPAQNPAQRQLGQLGQLIEAQARLADLLADAERRIPALAPQQPKLQMPKGTHLLMRPHAEHVQDPRMVASAFAMWLFYRNYLARRTPSHALLLRLLHRLHGLLLWQCALARDARGEALPLKEGTTRKDVPSWALNPADRATNNAVTTPIARVHEAHRAAGDNNNSGDNSGDNTAGSARVPGNPRYGFLPSPLDWWDEHGIETTLTAEEIRALRDVIDLRAFRQMVAARIPDALGKTSSFEEALAVLQAAGYRDLDIAHLLQAAWNGQAMLWAGQDLYGEAGVGGVFDIVDPYFLDYLRNQAGYLVSGIDETTRGTLADMLWRLQGGLPGVEPASWGASARALRQWNKALGNSLADMSPYRAYMISVTEIARAESFGGFVSMWTLGVQQKIWIVNAGACIICIDNAEQGPVDLLQPFPSGHQAPPAHPVCRCSASGAISDDFNPAAWQPRSAAAFDGFLFNSDYGNWPDVEFPLDLIEGRAVKPATTRARKPHTTPLAWPLLRTVRQVAEQAARDWLHQTRRTLPTTEAEIRTLARVPRDDVAAADDIYWRSLGVGLATALRAGRVSGRV